MLINNSTFGVKKTDKKLLEDWYKALKTIDLTNTYYLVTNKEGEKTQSIKETEFAIALNILIDIHRFVLIPLNDAGMIYPSGEEDYEMDLTI